MEGWASLSSPSMTIPNPVPTNPISSSNAVGANLGYPTVMALGRLLDQKSETKKCALCHERIPDNMKPCTFPSTAPAALAALKPHLGSDEAYYSSSSGPPKVFFCHTCWVWIYNLSICWTCGETVTREEEKVSYGWCWWHWACVSCLICRVGNFFFFYKYFSLILCFPGVWKVGG